MVASNARVMRSWRKGWPKSSTLVRTRGMVRRRMTRLRRIALLRAAGGGGINLTEDEQRMADARTVRLGDRILAEVDGGRAAPAA
jgi:hypothetical protein